MLLLIRRRHVGSSSGPTPPPPVAGGVLGVNPVAGRYQPPGAKFMSTSQRMAGALPRGMLVWDTTLGSLWVQDGVTAGGILVP